VEIGETGMLELLILLQVISQIQINDFYLKTDCGVNCAPLLPSVLEHFIYCQQMPHPFICLYLIHYAMAEGRLVLLTKCTIKYLGLEEGRTLI
jgi:hypothetical protein